MVKIRGKMVNMVFECPHIVLLPGRGHSGPQVPHVPLICSPFMFVEVEHQALLSVLWEDSKVHVWYVIPPNLKGKTQGL